MDLVLDGSRFREKMFDRHRGGGHPPTPATPPCVRVRTRRFETVTLHSSTKVGSPRDLKYALESPTVRALVRARGQGPRPLLAVRSEEHTSELQSRVDLVCRLLLEKKNL